MCPLTVNRILTVVCSGQGTFEVGGRWSVRHAKVGQYRGQCRRAVRVDEGNRRRNRECRVQSDGVHQPPAGKERGKTERSHFSVQPSNQGTGHVKGVPGNGPDGHWICTRQRGAAQGQNGGIGRHVGDPGKHAYAPIRGGRTRECRGLRR